MPQPVVDGVVEGPAHHGQAELGTLHFTGGHRHRAQVEQVLANCLPNWPAE